MITRKDLYRYRKIIAIGYCGAAYLLKPFMRTGYNSGVYGWNYDLYSFGNVAIITGYRNINGIRPDYKKLEAYNEKARIIWESWDLEYSEKEKQITELLQAFIAETT